MSFYSLHIFSALSKLCYINKHGFNLKTCLRLYFYKCTVECHILEQFDRRRADGQFFLQQFGQPMSAIIAALFNIYISQASAHRLSDCPRIWLHQMVLQ